MAEGSNSFESNEIADHLHHVVDHFRGKPRVGAEEHGLFHDPVGTRKITGDAHPGGIVAAELYESRLADQIAAEQHAVADLVGIEVGGQLGAGERRIFLDSDFKSKPGTRCAAARVIP